MNNIFRGVVAGLKWLGHEVVAVIDWVPKVLTLTKDVAQDVNTLLPQAVQVFSDVENIALAAIKDGGAALNQGQMLALAITEAGAKGIVNIAADEAVVAALNGFIAALDSKQTWTDVMTGISKLVHDYDTFGASAKAAIDQLAVDAGGR